MTIATDWLLADALDCLRSLARDRVRPDAARARFGALQRRFPDVRLDLLWQDSAADGSVQYDVLARFADGEGFVVSHAANPGLPWPLRGALPTEERHLLRVNATLLPVDQAIACLDFVWDEARLLDRLVDACLIQEALAETPIELTRDDLQRAMDAFRRARGLLSAESTRQWLRRRGLTHEKFEALVADQARVALLRARIAADRVEPYFANHAADLAVADLVRLDFPDEPSARRAFEAVRDGQTDFLAVAQERFLAGADPGGRPLFVTLRREQMPDPLGAAVFAADAGQLLPPIAIPNGVALVRVLRHTPAIRDAATRRLIERRLFAEWLAERRRTAVVEWNWGHADRIARTFAAADRTVEAFGTAW
jgi:putative peptide maturation system protein